MWKKMWVVVVFSWWKFIGKKNSFFDAHFSLVWMKGTFFERIFALYGQEKFNLPVFFFRFKLIISSKKNIHKIFCWFSSTIDIFLKKITVFYLLFDYFSHSQDNATPIENLTPIFIYWHEMRTYTTFHLLLIIQFFCKQIFHVCWNPSHSVK